MNWVYIKSEPGLWTVGFYDPQGKWHPESDYNTTKEAAERTHYLNGGLAAEPIAPLRQPSRPEATALPFVTP